MFWFSLFVALRLGFFPIVQTTHKIELPENTGVYTVRFGEPNRWMFIQSPYEEGGLRIGRGFEIDPDGKLRLFPDFSVPERAVDLLPLTKDKWLVSSSSELSVAEIADGKAEIVSNLNLPGDVEATYDLHWNPVLRQVRFRGKKYGTSLDCYQLLANWKFVQTHDLDVVNNADFSAQKLKWIFDRGMIQFWTNFGCGSCATCPDVSYLIGISGRPTLFVPIWKVGDPRDIYTIEELGGNPLRLPKRADKFLIEGKTKCDLSRDRRFAVFATATISADMDLDVWDLETGDLVFSRTFIGPRNPFNFIPFFIDDRRFIVVAYGVAYGFKIENGNVTLTRAVFQDAKEKFRHLKSAGVFRDQMWMIDTTGGDEPNRLELKFQPLSLFFPDDP